MQTATQTELKVPPQAPAHLLAAVQSKDEEQDASGTRRAIFPLDDGDVTLIYPEGLSTEALADLGAYLDIFLKKEQRKAKTQTER